MSDDIITRDGNGDLAVNVVTATEGNVPYNYDDCFTLDTNGRRALRVVGAGGGGGGAVSSVNGKTGAVVLDAEDVGAITQYSEMPEASESNLGELAQYKGETDETYTNGYFYKSELTDVTPSEISIEQYQGLGVVPSVDKDTFETQITTTGTYDFTYNGSSWSLDGSPVNIANYGITYTEEPEILTTTNVSSGVEDVYTNSETFASYVGQSGTYTFTYNGSGWELDGNVVDLSDYGITVLDLPTQYSVWQSSGGGNPDSLGNISVDIDVFMAMVGGIGEYRFYYSTDHWELYDGVESTTVDIADYGISFDGEPNQTAYVEWEQDVGDSNFELSINEQTFVQNTSGDEYYWVESSFTYDGTDWFRDGDSTNIVNLANYGITIDSGTPQAGDDIIVRYIPEYTIPYDQDEIVVDVTSLAGAESGDTITVEYEKGLDAGEVLRVDYTQESSEYNWVRTDVQPAGAAGIEWAGSWDKPENEYIYYSLRPVYSVPELADGHYEFYVKNTAYVGEANGTALCFPRVFKLDFYIYSEHDERLKIGRVSWVLDGSSTFNTNQYDNGLNSNMNVEIYNNNGIDSFYSAADVWRSIVQGTTAEIPNCFMWSNIKNVDTGEEIPVELSVRSSGSPSGNQIGGDTIELVEGVYIPNPPSYWTSETNISFDDNSQYIYLQATEGQAAYEFQINGKMLDGSEFSAIFTQNPDLGYDVRITKATGNFSDSQIGTSPSRGGEVFLFLNTPAGTTGMVTIYSSTSGSQIEPYVGMSDYDGSDFEQIGIKSVGYDVLKENFGTVEQYLGDTNANYTNGYFYKATGTKTVVPATATCTETEGAPATITISDADVFISAWSAKTGWSRKDVIYNLQNGNNSFRYRANYQRLYWENVGGYLNYNDISSFFDITPMPESGNVYFTVAYTPEVITITNGHWERVDVQPAAAPTTISVSLPVADWVNDEQTVVATGVTANSTVLICAAPASASEYNTCGVLCTAQGTDSLTFTCTTTPSNDLTVTVLMF